MKELSGLSQLLRFSIVGAAGFLVDAGTLDLALLAGADFYSGRLVSYLCAVTFTWAVNRRFTFRQRSEQRLLAEWFRFLISQIAGASVNLGVYAALVRTTAWGAAHPLVAVGVGSLAGLLVNFAAARRYVFKAPALGKSSDL
jgi:putative flippase GtrA